MFKCWHEPLTWVITRCPRKHFRSTTATGHPCGFRGDVVLKVEVMFCIIGVKKRMTEDPRTKKQLTFWWLGSTMVLKKMGWTRLNHCLVKVEGNHKPFQKHATQNPQLLRRFRHLCCHLDGNDWQWYNDHTCSCCDMTCRCPIYHPPNFYCLIPSHKQDWSLKVSIWWSYDDVSLCRFIVAGIQMIKPPLLQSDSVYVHFVILYVLYGCVCINITPPANLR